MVMIYAGAYGGQAGKAIDLSVKTDNFFIHDYFQGKQGKFRKPLQVSDYAFLLSVEITTPSKVYWE